MQSTAVSDAGIRYLTDDSGARIGVVLDLATYQRLVHNDDAELLRGLSDAELEALAAATLAPEAQYRLDALRKRQAAEGLSESDAEALDALLEQIDHLNILKARARYTLQTTGAAG